MGNEDRNRATTSGQAALDFEASAAVPEPPPPNPPATPRKGKRINMATVQPRLVSWLWDRRIARGKLAIIDGDPDQGKSLLTLDLAARISIGAAMPCEATAPDCPSKVLILVSEDGLHDTVSPRLIAAGADLQSIEVLPDLLMFPDDLPALEEHIRELDAKLVIIDPLNGYFSPRINTNSDHQARSVLIPLAQLAERSGAAIVGIRHFNKQVGGAALHRGGGSVAYSAVARTLFMVGTDPEDETARILAPIKGNLSAKNVPSLRFRIIATPEKQPRIEWLGLCDTTANRLCALPEDEESRSAHEHARDFLRQALANGPVLHEDLMARAKDQDIKPRTLNRAKKSAQVRSTKEPGPAGRWRWELQEAATVPQPLFGPVGHLGNVTASPIPSEQPGT